LRDAREAVTMTAMGLRDLFRRRDDETTSIGGLPGIPGEFGGPAETDTSTEATWSARISTNPIVHVQTTTIGPDGVPHTTTSGSSGGDVLAALPAVAREQLEALGLDDLFDGTAGGAVSAAAGTADDPIEKLRRLAELRDQGIVTAEEFATQKARLLGEL